MADQTTTIPKGWKMTTLGEVADVNSSTADRNYVFDEIEYIDVASVEERKLTEIQKLKLEDAPSRAKRIVTDNSVLVSTVRPNLKHYCFIKKAKPNLIASTGFAVVNSKEGKSDPYFLYNLLTTNDFTNFLIKVADSQTSTYPAFNPSIIQNSKFALPSYPEQRAIAAVLSSLDDKIELLREQNKTLEATAQAIFKEWFVNFNFPGATGKMIDSELGEIPEGWKIGGLIEDNISEFVKTNIDKFDGTKDYVETANVNLSNFVGNFEKITYEERVSRANMQPVANSIWFARMAESRKYLLFQGIDKKNIETKILSTGFAGIKFIKEYLYFYWCFILSDVFNDLKNQYAEGAVQVAISNGGIQRILLVLPPKDIAEKFTETVESCFEKISNNNSQIQTLSTLRDTLLPKLMKGEIRVKGFKN